MQFAIEHLGLPARNPQTLKDWYVRVLGAEIAFNDPPIALLRLAGGVMIEIYAAESSLEKTADNKLSGWRHVALRVDSIDAARAQLEQSGVKFTEQPRAAAGGGRVLFFQDPEGNLLHFVERNGALGGR